MRPNIEETLRRLTIEPLCLLHGGRGAGKTTSVLYVSALIAQREALIAEGRRLGEDDPAADELATILNAVKQDPAWYFYLDLEELRGQLKTASVCEILFQRVKGRAVELIPDFDPGWQAYVRGRFPPLIAASEALQATLRQAADLGISAEAIAPNISDTMGAWQQFERSDAGYKVELLLRYLASHHDVSVGCAVDNIDLFPEALQRDVALAMWGLCYTQKVLNNSIVGVRTEHLPLIFDALAGHVHLSSADVVGVEPNEDGFEVLMSILRRRLHVVPELIALAEVQEALEEQRTSGYIPEDDPSYRQTTLEFAIDIVTGLLAPSHDRPDAVTAKQGADKNYYKQLLQWHNGSIRAVCTSSYNVGFLIASDSDPIYRFSALVEHLDSFRPLEGSVSGEEFGRRVRDRVRFCRSFFIRQFVARPVWPLEFAHDLLIYEKPDRPVPRSQLPYLRLHLLQALSNRGGRSTIDELAAIVEPFGCARRRVHEALDGLRQPAHKPDDRGLLHVDSRSRASKADKKTSVSILPAGSYLVESLSAMNDYIFWNAFNTHDGEDFLGAKREAIRPSLMADERFRIEVALRYLEVRILPRYLGVFQLQTFKKRRFGLSGPDHATVLEGYLEDFGATPPPFAIANEIEDFCAAGKTIPRQFTEDVRSRCRAVKEAAKQPFLDVGAQGLVEHIHRRHEI